LSSAKDALHDDDVSQLQIPSLEKLGHQDVELCRGLSTEPSVLQPDETAIDVTKPCDDQNEDTSLEDIEAKVNFVSVSVKFFFFFLCGKHHYWCVAQNADISLQSHME